MTSPRVVELPRRLEPVGRDTFLTVVDLDERRARRARANVVALRPRDALALGRPLPPAAA